jgi:hypothetical protein
VKAQFRGAGLQVVVLLAAALATACRGVRPGAALTARESNRWTRSYALNPETELQIVNAAGTITVEGVGGSMAEVDADLVARATTAKAAQDLLPHITVSDEVTSERVIVRTDRIGGIMIGASVEVDYHVRVPFASPVRVRDANGDITLSGLAGRVAVINVNGGIAGTSLSGGVEARTVNGAAKIDLAKLGDDPIDVRTTNGEIELSLPATANGTVLATLVNGAIDVTGLQFETMGEQSRRRVRGRLNAGGTPVELATVNGAIHVRARD